LIIQDGCELILSKFDSKSEEIIAISSTDSDPFYFLALIFDQSNEDKFLIHNFTSFAGGSLADDKIVFGPVREFNIGLLSCQKLIGNQIHGFRWLTRNDAGDLFIKYRKVDLITLAEEIIQVPFDLNDGCFIPDFKVNTLLLYLILNKFRIIRIAGLERDCMLLLRMKKIGYFNYLMVFLIVFRLLLSHLTRRN
jgi:hypothetical protein